MLRYIDLFCGVGGFHQAAINVQAHRGISLDCAFASDIDPTCQDVYERNFSLRPEGDITGIPSEGIPPHDILMAGFPCQPFSIIGEMRGFQDTRGTLFYDIARILRDKRPQAFILENVKMLASHDRGNTLARILDVLVELGYSVSYRILNALDFGLPQKRERIVIVGFLRDADFVWPLGGAPMKPLREVLEEEVSEFYQASSAIQESRMSRQCPEEEPTIWHENKSGNISKHPYSCALRAGASYNYLLVNGRRRLTEREMFRLQGFPDEFLIHQTYTVARRHAGNSVPVPMIEAVLNSVLDALMERSPISEGSDRGKELKERT